MNVASLISSLLYGYRAGTLLPRKLKNRRGLITVTGTAAILTKWEGGIGGVDRVLVTMVEAIVRHGFKVDVLTEARLPASHYSVVEGPSVRVNVVGESTSLVDLDQYDFVYVFPYTSDELWSKQLRRTRALTIGLGGLPYTALPSYARFDVVHFESPSSRRSVLGAVLAPHDGRLGAQWREGLPPPPVSGEYILSVFNPWGPVKGLDDMLAFVEGCPLPTVWCYNATAMIHQNLSDSRDAIERAENHKNVIPARNLPLAQIYSFYQGCSGYASFSKSESFGWSVADAISFNKPICARKTGVLSYFPAFQPTQDFSRPVFSRVEVDSDAFFSQNIVQGLFERASWL